MGLEMWLTAPIAIYKIINNEQLAMDNTITILSI